MDIVRMRRFPEELVPQHLEDMLKAAGVVDINVGNRIITVHEEGQLHVAVAIRRLKTPGVSESRGWFMETLISLMEQTRIDVILRLLPKLFRHNREETISSELVELLDI